MPLKQFGSGDNIYIFDRALGRFLQGYDDNFGESNDITANFGGMDGTFLVDGSGAARKPEGQITQEMKLRAQTPEDMDAMRQDVLSLRGLGLQPLVYEQTDSSDALFFTYARVQVRAPRSEQNQSNLIQPVSLTFLVPDPYWYAASNGAILGLTFLMGVSTMGGTPTIINGSGAETDEVVSVSGTARTLVKITIEPDTGQSCENPIVQRIVDGQIHDQVSYTGTLTDTDSLVIDPTNIAGPTVLLNGSDAYDTDFDFKHLRWMSMLPGDNTIRVIFANPGDAADVTLDYFYTYEGS